MQIRVRCTWAVWTCKRFGATLAIVLWILYCNSLRRKTEWTEEQYLSENINRLRVATDHIAHSDYKPPEHPYLILAFISVKRIYGKTNLDYLTQVVGRFLQLLNDAGRKDVKLTICDASRYGFATNTNMVRVIRPENVHKFSNVGIRVKDKELRDYITCLKKLAQHKGSEQYIVLNEDDGIPVPTFFSNVFQVMHQLNQRRLRKEVQEVSHVKFYHPTRLRKLPWLIYTFVVPLFIVSFLRLIFLLCGTHLECGWYLAPACCICLFIFSLGPDRVGWWHHKLVGFVPLVPQESCCTVSILFPCDTLNRTIAYMDTRMNENLRENLHQPKDGILDSLPSGTAMKVLMTEFDFVQHIGKFSTIGH